MNFNGLFPSYLFGNFSQQPTKFEWFRIALIAKEVSLVTGLRVMIHGKDSSSLSTHHRRAAWCLVVCFHGRVGQVIAVLAVSG